jgi:SAM-dependent methyltransferase
MDADPAAAAVAREALGDAAIVCGDLDDEVFAGQCFDAITLSNVIEHLPDPARTNAACRRLLSPSGQLVVSTPNAFSLGRSEFETSWLHWDPPRHLQIFNPVNLSKLVKSAGFEVKACFTPSTSSVAVWAGSQTIRRRGRLPGVRIGRAKWRDIVGGFTFWLREYRAVHAGGRCGEDLVVIATPTTGEWRPS